MGLLRSEKIKHGTLVLPSNRAHGFVSLIGMNCKVQILDMNQHSVNRPYKKYILRVEEIERILRFLFDELGKLPNAEVTRGSIEIFLKNDSEYNLEKVEEKLQTLYNQFIEFKVNNADLMEQKNAALLEKYVALAAMTQLQPKRLNTTILNRRISDVSASELLLNNVDSSSAEDEKSLKNSDETSRIFFSNVAGVIVAIEQERFARTLFRATRGNTYTLFQTIPEPIIEAKTGKLLNRSVFVVYYQGSSSSVLYEKIIKICKAFDAYIYSWPRTHESAAQRLTELEQTISDKEKALIAYENYMVSEVSVLLERTKIKGSSLIEEWRRFAMKEKLIYNTLNLFEGTDITLRADCWFPEAEEENIRRILMSEANQDQVSAFLLSDKMIPEYSNPPTYIKVNEFTRAFQNFVDTYGVPRYREANPAIFTIITLPFLFGVMFGDVGHGCCLLLFSLFLILYSKFYKINFNQSEILQTMFFGRYMLLLMGIFAIYSGFLYNDFFSLGLNMFGTRWNIDETNDKMNTWKPGENFPYPFGFDPKWKGALNELAVSNSFKMKFAVIVGFVQMTGGILLKAINAIYFKQPLDFFLEFLPQIVFLLSLVGYMIFLIIIKWATPVQNNNKPLLINTIIGMCMFERIHPKDRLFAQQEFVQKILVMLMVISIPIMLFVKPSIKYLVHKFSKNSSSLSRHSTEDLFADLEKLSQFEEISSLDDEFNFGEAFIHQIIGTVEFVLGTISNTASYLRLWALSLAHQQLSLVFYEKTILLALNSSDNIIIVSLAVIKKFYAEL